MSKTTTKIQIAALALTIGLGACAMDEEEMGTETQAGLNMNGLNMNGLNMNGLNMNGLNMNGLPQSSLAGNGINTASNQSWDAWLNDPQAGAFNNILMSYVARCALPAGENTSFVDEAGVVRSWNGQIGLASNWSNTALTTEMQETVTSCVLSLANSQGQNVQISQRGTAGSYSVSEAELQAWNYTEGAFFGNMFSANPTLYSCAASNDYQSPGNGRDCTQTDANDVSMCNPIEVLGLCSDICDTVVRTEGGESYTVYTNCEGADNVIYSNVTTTALNVN